jgi:hypothetical protein
MHGFCVIFQGYNHFQNWRMILYSYITLHYIAFGGSSFSHNDCKNWNMPYKYMEKVSLCITVVNLITAIGLIVSVAFLCPVLKIV